MNHREVRQCVEALLVWCERLLSEARRQLAAANMRLVGYMWDKMKRYGMIRRLGDDEFRSLAYEALMLSAHKYDPRRVSPKTGKIARFSTYVCNAIYANAWRDANKHGLVISVPLGSAYTALSGGSKRLADLARRTIGGLTSQSRLKLCPYREEEAISDHAALLRSSLGCSGLTPKEDRVLRLLLCQNMTEAGREMGVSKERVRQLRNAAIEKVKQTIGGGL